MDNREKRRRSGALHANSSEEYLKVFIYLEYTNRN